MAGQSATAITLVNDPDSTLPAAGHALIASAQDVPSLLAAMRQVLEVPAEFDAEDRPTPIRAACCGPCRAGQSTQAGVVDGEQAATPCTPRVRYSSQLNISHCQFG
jgi:hypothetical protein